MNSTVRVKSWPTAAAENVPQTLWIFCARQASARFGISRAAFWLGRTKWTLPCRSTERSTEGYEGNLIGGEMAATKITVNHNGPLRLEGDLEVLDPLGKAFGLAGRTVISLCRCGHSANKPFCDGAHKTAGFTHEVTARDLPAPKPK